MGERVMVFGLSLETYTLLHVLISLVGIAAGFVVVYGLLNGKRLDGITAVFLAFTVATSITGFGFPFTKLLPSHITGIISLIVLLPTLYARYGRNLAGAWRWIYVVGAVLAFYLNVFVLIVQLFLKVPAINALAPTQAEPPFLVAQGAVLLIFIAFGVFSLRGFRGQGVSPA